MNHKRKLTVAVVAVALVALVAAGTSYARSLSPRASLGAAAIEATGQPLDCGGGAAGDMHSAMGEGLARGLGLTTDQLREELSSGKTLDKLAAEKGLGADKLAEAMRAAMKEGLDKLVAEGKLTREKADAALGAAKRQMTPEHVASMGDMGSMHDGATDMGSMHDGSTDMGAMHDGATDMGAMHGSQGSQDGGSCHDGSSEGGKAPSQAPPAKGMMGKGMMGQSL